MEREVVAVIAGMFGLLFGSFANVAVYRIPRRESLASPPSHCPACGTPVAPRDNIPVLSWLLLRGRCRSCSAPISARYPAVELLTGLLFAATALRIPDRAGHTMWDLAAFLPLVLVMVVLAFIDIEHKLLPNRIVLPALGAEVVLVAVAAFAGPGPGALARAVLAAAASFGAFLALALISPRGMGMGDVKLSALLGLALGYLGWGRVFIGFLAAFLLGALGGIALIALRRGGMKSQVPFGPYLVTGAMVSILAGGPLVELWLGTGT